jgi:hypothetical protein
LGDTDRKNFEVEFAAHCLPPAYCPPSAVLENLDYGFAVDRFMLGGISIAI